MTEIHFLQQMKKEIETAGYGEGYGVNLPDITSQINRRIEKLRQEEAEFNASAPVKPTKPVEPQLKDYSEADRAYDASNTSKWTRDYNKWQKDIKEYNKNMIAYTQRKNVRLVKNASEKHILANYTITKND